MFYGVDVGQEGDPAAEVVIVPAGERAEGDPRPVWRVLGAGRIPKGSYAALAEHVAARKASLGQGRRPVLTAVDATGCGRPVVEMIRDKAGSSPSDTIIGATFTAGRSVGGVWPNVTVGKTLLVEHVQTALERGGLVVGDDCPGGVDLLGEMRRYVQRESGRTEAASGHDDLVCALMLAVWLGDTVAEQMDRREALARG